MRVLPKTPAQQIEKLTTLIQQWQADPDGLGLSQSQVLQLRDLLAEAQKAHDAAIAARVAAKNATLAFEQATGELVKRASTAILMIKTKARLSASSEAVLAKGGLPAPSPRRRAIPAHGPSNGSVRVDQLGRATLAWRTGAGGARGARLGRDRKGGNAILYDVYRRAEGSPHAERLGHTYAPTFVDPAPLPGLSVYEITATRGGVPAMHRTIISLSLPAAA